MIDKKFIEGVEIHNGDLQKVWLILEEGKPTRFVNKDEWIDEQKEYVAYRDSMSTCSFCGEEVHDDDMHIHSTGVTVCEDCVNVDLYDLRSDIAGILRDELYALLESFHDRLPEKYPYALRRSISEKLSKQRPSDMEDPVSRITDGSYTEDNIVG